jgi:exopolyphosphatase / guanosine-5'-triphosphate,3'-diphosphate pyrophosphatase
MNLEAATRDRQTAGTPNRSPVRVAVVDIGTNSIRMSIAEIGPGQEIRTLETLYQAVNLGKDTFTGAAIKSQTIEECVKTLRGYKQILEQYDIRRPEQIRVVATSAVYEAANQWTFINRIYIATGILVEPLDDAEANRFAYLAIQPLLQKRLRDETAKTIIIEVGGGNTEILVVQDEDVVFAHTYRLGSLRLRQTLEAHQAPSVRVRNMMESQINRTVEQAFHEMSGEGAFQMIALGGDIRFAARQLSPDSPEDTAEALPVPALAQLTEKVLAMTPDELVRKYHLPFTEAETLGPALLAYLKLARAFRIERIQVANVHFRDGVLKEMAFQGTWPEGFTNQITRSALNLGRKYNFDEAHGVHVAKLCKSLFQSLREEHRLDARYELLLCIAALLHDIGNFVSNRSHHKHSMYLILHGELLCLSQSDMLLTALTARYHRRASPKPLHEGYMTLDRESRIVVAKMAALLRVADALDRSDRQRIDEIQCTLERDRLVISVPRVEDLSLEQLALRQKGPLFEEVFGRPILLRKIQPADD